MATSSLKASGTLAKRMPWAVKASDVDVVVADVGAQHQARLGQLGGLGRADGQAAGDDHVGVGHLGGDRALGVRERRHQHLDPLRQQGGVGGVLRVDLPAGAAGEDHPPRHLPSLPAVPARGQGGLDARGHWRSVLLTS